jgi:hypothetical protein
MYWLYFVHTLNSFRIINALGRLGYVRTTLRTYDILFAVRFPDLRIFRFTHRTYVLGWWIRSLFFVLLSFSFTLFVCTIIISCARTSVLRLLELFFRMYCDPIVYTNCFLVVLEISIPCGRNFLRLYELNNVQTKTKIVFDGCFIFLFRMYVFMFVHMKHLCSWFFLFTLRTYLRWCF